MAYKEHASDFETHFSPSSINAFFMEHARVRDQLPEKVRALFDVLRHEVIAICEAHGVDTPEKLGREGKRPAMETLERIQKLMNQIHYILEHRELSPDLEKKEISLDDREYTLELGPEYKLVDICNPCNHYGGFTCVVSDPSGKTKFVIDQEKRLIGDPEGYDEVWEQTDIGGKPAFLAKRDRKKFVVLDGKTFGSFEGHDDIHSLTDVGGKPAFFAKKGDRWFVFWDGKIVGSMGGYKGAHHLINVGGEPAYAAVLEEGSNIFIMKGNQIVGDEEGYFASVGELVDIEGKVGWHLNTGKHDGNIVLLDGRVMGDERGYGRLSNLVNMGGEIGFVAQTKEKKTLFIIDGQPVLNLTQDLPYFLERLISIGGKMACKIPEKPPIFSRVYFDGGLLYNNGEIVSGVQQIIDIGGKILVVTEMSTGSYIEGTSLKFDYIYSVYALDHERFAVVAREGGKIIKRVYPLSQYHDEDIYPVSS